MDRGSIVFERFSNFIFIFRLIEDRGSSNYLRERFFSPSTRFQPIRNDFPINFPIIFIFRLSVDRGSIISERFSNFIFTFRLIKDRGSVRSSNYFDVPFGRREGDFSLREKSGEWRVFLLPPPSLPSLDRLTASFSHRRVTIINPRPTISLCLRLPSPNNESSSIEE